MTAKINIRHMEGVTVLEVSGRIVLGDGGIVFRDSFHDVLKTGTQKVVVDLGGVNYMDSCGLGELANAYTSAKARGCDVKLAGLTRKLDNLLLITKLATVFDIYLDEVEAVAAFCSTNPHSGKTGPAKPMADRMLCNSDSGGRPVAC